MKLRFSESDIKQNTILDTNWYQVTITGYADVDSGNNQGKTWVNSRIDMVVNSENPKYNNVPVRKSIPEFIKEEQLKIVRAMSGGDDVDTDATYNLSAALVGEKFLVFIQPEVGKDGRTRNNVKEWKSLDYLDTLKAQGVSLG